MQVNLVSFNVPYPPNYGGVIDVYYKIKALSELGVAVHLHCFEYDNRVRSKELEKICASIHYYPRKRVPLQFLSSVPFIVQTRNSSELISNLNRNTYPVIFEGLHCTFPIFSKMLNERILLVRTHNIEHNYYLGLARTERNFFRKLFFKAEARKLKKYESVLSRASAIAAISPNDRDYFSQYGRPIELITPFHPFAEVEIEHGMGSYILIHGDLSVPENVQSVTWLVENIASKVPYRVVVAGKSPNSALVKLLKKYPNIDLFINPNETLMSELVANAHINLVHSFYPQGFKLKMLHSLYSGRFFICNLPVVENTGLEKLCMVANSPQEYIQFIEKVMSIPFEKELIKERKVTLELFSNTFQAKKLVKLIQL